MVNSIPTFVCFRCKKHLAEKPYVWMSARGMMYQACGKCDELLKSNNAYAGANKKAEPPVAVDASGRLAGER